MGVLKEYLALKRNIGLAERNIFAWVCYFKMALRTWLSRHMLIAQIANAGSPRLATYRVRSRTVT
jgi:hypothetical protein